MADAASSKVKVAALKKTRLDIVNLFDQDMRDGHPGSGRAEIAFGTWRRDDGRVIRVVRKRLRPLRGVSYDHLQVEVTKEALATFEASHMQGFPELVAWDPVSTTLILEDMGRITLDAYFNEAKDELSMDHAEAVFYKVLCLIVQLHSVGVFHLDLSWTNLVMEADSVEKAISRGLRTRINVLDLGACKVSPSAHAGSSQQSDGQAHSRNDCIDVEDCRNWRTSLNDMWEGLFRDTKMMGIGNGHVNGRRQDLCTLGRMMVDQLPLNDMAPDLADLVRGMSSTKFTERFDPSAPLHEHVFSKRMRTRAVHEGWASFVAGSKDPTTDADVGVPATMSESDIDAFRKVAEQFRNPLDMVRTMMSSLVYMSRKEADAEDAAVAVGASPSGSEAVVEDDGEEGWGARERLSNPKGKGKAQANALAQTISARGNNTATLEEAVGAAGAADAAGTAGATSQPVVVAATESASATPRAMAAPGRGTMGTAGSKQSKVPSRIQPCRSCKTTVSKQGKSATKGAKEARPATAKRGRRGGEVGGVAVMEMAPSNPKVVQKARGGRGSATTKRRRVDGESAESLERVTVGGGPRKRHRTARAAVSEVASTLSGVAATSLVAKAKSSARPPLLMTLRSMTMGTTATVAVKKDIPKGKGSRGGSYVDGGGSSRQDGHQQGDGFGYDTAATSSSSRYR